MERVYFIQKTDVIDCLENGYKVYYTDKGSTEIYDFNEECKLSDLKNADYILAVEKG